jgi:hypothetical protein
LSIVNPACTAQPKETNPMPQVTESTPRAEIVIQGATFLCPQPYAEGHSLNANEASALNQVYAENIRNNLAGKIKKAREADENYVLPQEEFDAYASSYEFGVRQASGPRAEQLPPDVREARKIAREKITEALKAKGIIVKSVDKDWMETNVAALAGREDILKEARRRIKQVQTISLEELDLGDVRDSAQAEAQAA